RNRGPAQGAVAVADRDDLPGQVPADVVIESPSSVRPEAGSGASAAPRPGARPQRPGHRRPTGKQRR
ncbi:MAG: secF, partial [Blastococcus sp.]|nr:secF [Blastococcus sp.]